MKTRILAAAVVMVWMSGLLPGAWGAAGSLVSGGPGADLATNAFWVYSTPDTNNLYVTLAGEANANGQYTFKTAFGAGYSIYTNVNGQYGLINDANLNFAHQGIITNSAGSSRYISDNFLVSSLTGVSGTWSVDLGTPAAPTVVSGTNFFTNNISAVATQGPLVRSDTNFWVSGYLGNDSTFSRGVGYAKTLGAVFQRPDLTNGDIVVIWPGPVERGTNKIIQLLTGMRVVGYGMGISTVVDTNTSTLFSIADNCVMEGFDIAQTLSGSSFGTPISIPSGKTNWTVNRVRVRSYTDCIVLPSGGAAQGQFNNCDFGNAKASGSVWDTYFDQQVSAGTGLIEFNGCTFGVNATAAASNPWGTFNSAKCLAVGGTPIRLNYCFLYMDGGATTNASCIRTITGNTSPKIELNSCVLTNRGTGTNFTIINDGNGAGVLGNNSGALFLRNTTIARSNIYGGFTLLEAQNDWQYGRVSGSDATTTGQSLVDVTGLSVACDTNALYEFEAVLSVSTTAVTTGTKYGVQYSVAGGSVEAQLVGSLTTTASQSERINALNTATANAYLTTSAQSGQVIIKGILQTGTTSGNLTIQHLKVTSGTSTVFQKSYLKAKRIL